MIILFNPLKFKKVFMLFDNREKLYYILAYYGHFFNNQNNTA